MADTVGDGVAGTIDQTSMLHCSMLITMSFIQRAV
jgi:hypothetical protein